MLMKANRAAQTLCLPTGAACTQLGVPVPHVAVPGGSLPTEMTDAASARSPRSTSTVRDHADSTDFCQP